MSVACTLKFKVRNLHCRQYVVPFCRWWCRARTRRCAPRPEAVRSSRRPDRSVPANRTWTGCFGRTPWPPGMQRAPPFVN